VTPSPGPDRLTRFSGAGFRGESTVAMAADELAVQAERLFDDTAATETVHWGRNYLYSAFVSTPDGSVEVVVKQFRNQGWRRRLERRVYGSKAERAWRAAFAILDAGLCTPEPLMVVESDAAEGPSFFISRRLEAAHEVRHFFRRLNGTDEAEPFPEVDEQAFLADLGRLARRLNDAGIWYRDLSLGNVLARQEDERLELYLVDANRARVGRRLGLLRRTRDICRFPIVQQAHRDAFLAGYWGRVPGAFSPRSWLYVALVRAFLAKHALKNRLRRKGAKRRVATGGRHNAHIPAAADGAAARDRSVWDRLTDQPHQHAGKLDKTWIRLADAPSHLGELASVALAAPRVWRRYRRLAAGLYRQPTPFSGCGVCVRPWGDDPGAQLDVLDDLGVGAVLLRLHPWEGTIEAEHRLAQGLVERGYELTVAVPQNRELVRNPERWTAVVEEVAERFVPLCSRFAVGHAINRSKWGIWTRSEYVRLYERAAEILRRHPGVELIGPSVIDFEYQVTAAVLNRRRKGLRFDVVSSLLYVDRRGAPENPQLGFDTVGKVVLLRAIAETSRSSSERCWITEVNWPLWEGPHSPAGRKVSVDEERQADYLARYYLLALGTGLVERVFWWRLAARGYGLVDPAGEMRRRPSFTALRALNSLVEGSSFLGPLPSDPGSFLYRFRRQGVDLVAAWSLEPGARGLLRDRPVAAFDRGGEEVDPPRSAEVELGPSPRYLVMP